MRKIFIIFLIIIIIAAFLGWAAKITFCSQSGNSQYKLFVIKEGESVSQISHDLKNQGLLDSVLLFKSYLWLHNSSSKILAGEHKINDSWSIRQLVNALTSGISLENETVIKILEGWNLRDIAKYLSDKSLVKEDDFYKITGQPGVNYDLDKSLDKPVDFSADYEFLKEKPKNLSLEGYLFPDTYRVYKNATAEDIIRKMLDNFDQKLNSNLLGEIDNQSKKLYDILTLASVIEKEANNLEDKKRVAGVYYNRLKIGMALQADPTVNYITEKQTDRPSYDDLQIKNLYNTYKYPGLPPGPICNPGLDSILAAIYPEKNGYFYFINTPDGHLIFAKTLAEHKANRLKYFNE